MLADEAVRVLSENGFNLRRIDAAGCAVAGQTTLNGYYNIERMMKYSINKGAKAKICGSCADARRLKKIFGISLWKNLVVSAMVQFTE